MPRDARPSGNAHLMRFVSEGIDVAVTTVTDERKTLMQRKTFVALFVVGLGGSLGLFYSVFIRNP